MAVWTNHCQSIYQTFLFLNLYTEEWLTVLKQDFLTVQLVDTISSFLDVTSSDKQT